MIALILLLSFVSVLYFPWVVSGLLIIALAFVDPLGALATGLFADVLYYNPQAELIPLFTIGSALMAGIALFVRSRLRTSTL